MDVLAALYCALSSVRNASVMWWWSHSTAANLWHFCQGVAPMRRKLKNHSKFFFITCCRCAPAKYIYSIKVYLSLKKTNNKKTAISRLGINKVNLSLSACFHFISSVYKCLLMRFVINCLLLLLWTLFRFCWAKSMRDSAPPRWWWRSLRPVPVSRIRCSS